MDLTLSKYPHFNSTYLVRVRFSLDLAVFYVGVVGESNNSNDWAMPPAGQLNYVSTKFCP